MSNTYWRLEVGEIEDCITFVFSKKPSVEDIELRLYPWLNTEQITELLREGEFNDVNHIRCYLLSEEEFDN